VTSSWWWISDRGGPTDFTLSAVTERCGELSVNRVSVGDTFCWAATMGIPLAGVVAGTPLAEKGQTKIDSRQPWRFGRTCAWPGKSSRAGARRPKEHPVTISGEAPVGGRALSSKRGWPPISSRCSGRFPSLPTVRRALRWPAPARLSRIGSDAACPYAPDPGDHHATWPFFGKQAAQGRTRSCGADRAAGRARPTCSLSGLACSTATLVR